MNCEQASNFVNAITDCVGSYNQKETEKVCAELIEQLKQSDETFPAGLAKKILARLRDNRYFQLMIKMAEAFILNGQEDAQIIRQYAQALLDNGQVSAAIPLLEELTADTQDNPEEHLEAKGLLGRAFKQRYIDVGHARTARARQDLITSFEWYYNVYQSDPTYYWHGINAAALLKRAVNDQVDIPGIADAAAKAAAIAGDILQSIRNKPLGIVTMWDYGTAAEACVALDKTEEAGDWLQRYVADPYANAFEIASTVRQFKEVWQLNSNVEPGMRLLSILYAKFIGLKGAHLLIDADDIQQAASQDRDRYLQKVLGTDSYTSYKELCTAIERGRCVARIQDYGGYGGGTGFLIRGNSLHPALGTELFVLTNAHVVSDDVKVCSPKPLLPDEARVTFQVLQEEGVATREYAVAGLVWTSPPVMLDATLLRLTEQVENIQPYPVAPRLPAFGDQERVYIIGHPKGGTLSFSIQDNALIDHEGPVHGTPEIENVVRLQYRAPTDAGSSGSPVFDRQWRLIGLHHAGGAEMPKLNRQPGVQPANEGIWIQSIIAAMKRDPQNIGKL
jgi:hypothetical protein